MEPVSDLFELTPPLGQQHDVLIQGVPVLGLVTHLNHGHQDPGRWHHVWCLNTRGEKKLFVLISFEWLHRSRLEFLLAYFYQAFVLSLASVNKFKHRCAAGLGLLWAIIDYFCILQATIEEQRADWMFRRYTVPSWSASPGTVVPPLPPAASPPGTHNPQLIHRLISRNTYI